MSALTVIRTFKTPWKVGGQEARDFEVRPPTMEDIMEAEKVVSPLQPNAFNVEMACRTMVRAGSFTGPFVRGQFTGMAPARFQLISQAMREAEELGED